MPVIIYAETLDPGLDLNAQITDFGSNTDIGEGDPDLNGPIMPFLLISFSFLLMFLLSLFLVAVQNCFNILRSRNSDYDIDDEEFDDEFQNFNELNLMYNETTESDNDNLALTKLSPNDQELYFQAKEFIKLNGFAKMNLSNWQLDLIKDKGVNAFNFSNLNENPLINIQNKSEITFKNKNIPLSIQSNLPIPLTKDIHYIEFKIFDIPNKFKNSTLISLGLATYPYPSFVLPGRYLHSISYDSNGDRYHNMPFPITDFKNGKSIFPKINQGDVIGLGIKKRSRSIFFTRNGKKLSESKIGGHIKLPKGIQFFPTIGSLNPCRIDVNFGQLGYVFIEANVKKWSLAPLIGNELPPPIYKKFNNDVLLDYSDNEDSNDLPEFEEIIQHNSNLLRNASFTDDDIGNDEVTLETIDNPPNYDNLIQLEINEAMGTNIDG